MFDQLPLFPHADEYFLFEVLDEGAESEACSSCGVVIADEDYCDGDGSHYCDGCAQALTEKWFKSAQAFAEQHCQITGELPEYKPELEYSCTPQDYEDGIRDSYTPNSYLCRCRHRCTNYEKLIADLSREDAEDQVYHAVIQHRIDEILIDHEDFMREDVENM